MLLSTSDCQFVSYGIVTMLTKLQATTLNEKIITVSDVMIFSVNLKAGKTKSDGV